jgi:SPP1 gp7 family putative phage head morphogenesis protein
VLGSREAAAFLKFQAFSVATVENDRLLTRIKAALAGNLKRGDAEKSFTEIVNREFDKAGVTRLNPFHLETVYRTNAAMAFSGGQIAALDNVKGEFPLWRYSAVKDRRTRPSHRALDGKLFRTGDYKYYPPISFRCRCEAIPLSRLEAQSLSPSDLPADLETALGKTEFIGNKNQKFLNWLQRQPLSKEAAEKIRPRLIVLMAVFDDNLKMPKPVKSIFDLLKKDNDFIKIESSTSNTFTFQHKNAQAKDLPLNLDAAKRLNQNGYSVIIREHFENKGKQPELEIIDDKGNRFISDLKTPNPKEYGSLITSIKNQFASAEKQEIKHLVVDIIDLKADNFTIARGIEEGFKHNRVIERLIVLKGDKSAEITREQFLRDVVRKEVKRKL